MSKEESASSEAREIHEFFAADPVAADIAFFERETSSTGAAFAGRRLAAMTAMGRGDSFHRSMPAGHSGRFRRENQLVGKDGLTLLTRRPLNAETLPSDRRPVTPTSRHSFATSGVPHEASADSWTLTVDGLVERP